ncbi:hypothetical protein PP339_gp032 [Mycobacterium phage Onyinye]|uniref:Uncharacterized protein n=1 Tax=Mycobacterium phage Onyinye TaxID=2686235 RepID=A0A6B9LD05_9CAUD|nr:hypothetical protein PP339_gp032 [Mycobacterium phage Onyinye]QHB37438.1 hypothetical protein SEA_ONYINYE_32 [Mycobacterium phage Onyinye]
MAESKATASKNDATAAAIAAEEGGVVDSPKGARNVLTENMPQPPSISQRRRRSKALERKGPFVKYVGGASHRVIRAADWGQLGFKPKDEKTGHQEFLWSAKNDYMVESEKFTDEQLDYLLIDDVMPGGGQSFLEVDYEEDENGNKVLVQVVDEDE